MKGPARHQAMFQYASPVQKTNWDRAIVLFDLMLGAFIATQILIGFYHSPLSIAVALLFLPVTFFITDLIGQSFHKWLDSYASETHFLWGKAAQEFRKHHEHPINLNHVDYLSHVSAFGRIMSPFFIAASFVHWQNLPALGFNTLLLIFVLLNATEIHKQAHKRTPHWFASILQKTGLFLTYEKHIKHHRAPFDSDYAVINGWSQVLTDKTGFWHKMDLLWWKHLKELPGTWIQDPRAIPESVVAELMTHPEKIPADLVAYAEIYPERSNETVKKLLSFAQSS
jgi:ubiquitin-conjugating enzyme E2 variant